MRIPQSCSMLSQRTCDKVEHVAGTRARLEVASLCSGRRRRQGARAARAQAASGERCDCDDRRRNATGNQFQEGRGPLPRRISPAVKRADKCGGHLRQHRPMRPRLPAPRPRTRHLHSTRHWVRNQSNGLSAFYLQYLLHAPGPPLPNIALILSVLRPRHSLTVNLTRRTSYDSHLRPTGT